MANFGIAAVIYTESLALEVQAQSMVLLTVKVLQRPQCLSELADLRLNGWRLICLSLVAVQLLARLHDLSINGEGVVTAVRGRVPLLPSGLHCFTVLGKEVRHARLMLIIFELVLQRAINHEVNNNYWIQFSLMMNRLRVKEGDPPLKYFLPLRPNRITRMKDKVACVASSILSYFQEYNRTSPQVSGSQHDEKLNSSLSEGSQTTNKTEPNKVDTHTVNMIAKKAHRLVRLSDISSQSDTWEEHMQEVPQGCSSIKLVNLHEQQQPKSISYNTNTSFLNRQLMDRKRKDAEQEKPIKMMKVVITPHDNDEQPKSQPQQDSQEKDSLVLSISASGSDSQPNSFRSAKALLRKFQVEQSSLDGDQIFYNFNAAGMPKKKVKLMNDRYLKSLEELEKKKSDIINKIRPSTSGKERKIEQQKINQEKLKKRQKQPNFSQCLQKLENELVAISKRKVGDSRILKVTPQFSAVTLEIKPKKFDMNLEKILEAVKQQKNVAQQDLVIEPVEEKHINVSTASVSGSLPFAANSSTQSPFIFPATIGQAPSKQPSLSKQENNDQAKKENPFANIFSNSSLISKKEKPDQNSKKDNQQSLKPEKEIGVDLIEKKSSKKEDDLKPPMENPFIKKTSQVRPVLPDFIANFNVGDLFTPKQPSANIGEVGQKPQQAGSNGGFSTPTKNIYEKYPDKLNAAPAIPESQEDESSMFDESEHSASRKDEISHSPLRGMSQISNPFNSNSSSIMGGQSFVSQPLFSSGDPRSSFLSVVPKIDIQKSMKMFGRSAAINVSSSDALWGTPVDDSSRKKSEGPKNNKKKKQQRAYA